jgi:group I intron endonuclease
MKESGIYLITCKPTGKVYVGQSTGRTGVAGGLKEHKRALKWGRDSVHLQRAWDKYGEDAFSFEVILVCPPEQCDHWEDHFIEEFQSWKRDKGFNIRRSASGRGYTSEETRQRLSLKKRQRRVTEETKARMSLGQKGRVHGEETRRKISEANIGRKMSEEQKARRNLSRWGRSPSTETRGKQSEKMLGRKWYNNGEINKRFTDEESRLLDPLIWKSGRKPLNPRKRCPPYE